MSSDAGESVDRSLIAHRQGLNRGEGTSTVPNSEFNRRARVSFSGRRLWQCEQRRRSALYSATRPRTRCRSTPANTILPSSRDEWGSEPPPQATSWVCFVPSAPLSSIVTRQSIPAPGLPCTDVSTPMFGTVSPAVASRHVGQRPALRPATPDFALRFDGRMRVHNADAIMARIAAELLVEHPDRSGYV